MQYGIIVVRQSQEFSVHTSLGWFVDDAKSASAVLRGIFSYVSRPPQNILTTLFEFNLHWNGCLCTDLLPGCEDVPRVFRRVLPGWDKPVNTCFLVTVPIDSRWIRIGTIRLPKIINSYTDLNDALTTYQSVSVLGKTPEFIDDPDYPFVEQFELSNLG